MALHDLSARYDVAEVKFGLGGGGLHRSYVGFTLIDGKGDVSLCGGIDTEGGIST
jgi:hypothetical protein